MSYSVEELEEKVRGALNGTSNRSAPGVDGMGYRFMKIIVLIIVLNTRLGRVGSGGGDVIKIYYLFIFAARAEP